MQPIEGWYWYTRVQDSDSLLQPIEGSGTHECKTRIPKCSQLKVLVHTSARLGFPIAANWRFWYTRVQDSDSLLQPIEGSGTQECKTRIPYCSQLKVLVHKSARLGFPIAANWRLWYTRVQDSDSQMQPIEGSGTQECKTGILKYSQLKALVHKSARLGFPNAANWRLWYTRVQDSDSQMQPIEVCCKRVQDWLIINELMQWIRLYISHYPLAVACSLLIYYFLFIQHTVKLETKNVLHENKRLKKYKERCEGKSRETPLVSHALNNLKNCLFPCSLLQIVLCLDFDAQAWSKIRFDIFKRLFAQFN